MAQAQVPRLPEVQAGTIVQGAPGSHPVLMSVYSIKDPSCREVSAPQPPPPLPRAHIPPDCKRWHWVRSQTVISTRSPLFPALGYPPRNLPALSLRHSQGSQRLAVRGQQPGPVCMATREDFLCGERHDLHGRSQKEQQKWEATGPCHEVWVSAHHPRTPGGC